MAISKIIHVEVGVHYCVIQVEMGMHTLPLGPSEVCGRIAVPTWFTNRAGWQQRPSSSQTFAGKLPVASGSCPVPCSFRAVAGQLQGNGLPVHPAQLYDVRCLYSWLLTVGTKPPVLPLLSVSTAVEACSTGLPVDRHQAGVPSRASVPCRSCH